MMDVRASSVASSCRVSQGGTAVENQVTSLVDALPDIVWTALPDGNVDFLNQPWYDFTGLGGDHAYGQSWQAAIHPADLAELLDRWRAILASGEPGDMEARIRRFDGEFRQSSPSPTVLIVCTTDSLESGVRWYWNPSKHVLQGGADGRELVLQHVAGHSCVMD